MDNKETRIEEETDKVGEIITNTQARLDEDTQKIAQRLVETHNGEEVKDLAELFNINQIKKQVVRSITYNQLLDGITDQMKERITKRADQFSNKDLLDYAKHMVDSLDKAQTKVSQVDTTPLIQINQQNNTVINNANEGSEEKLSRESKLKIAEAVRAIMNKANQQNQPTSNDDEEEESQKEEEDDTVTIIEEEEIKNNYGQQNKNK